MKPRMEKTTNPATKLVALFRKQRAMESLWEQRKSDREGEEKRMEKKKGNPRGRDRKTEGNRGREMKISRGKMGSKERDIGKGKHTRCRGKRDPAKGWKKLGLGKVSTQVLLSSPRGSIALACPPRTSHL